LATVRASLSDIEHRPLNCSLKACAWAERGTNSSYRQDDCDGASVYKPHLNNQRGTHDTGPVLATEFASILEMILFKLLCFWFARKSLRQKCLREMPSWCGGSTVSAAGACARPETSEHQGRRAKDAKTKSLDVVVAARDRPQGLCHSRISPGTVWEHAGERSAP
jgi:hypothetical protein